MTEVRSSSGSARAGASRARVRLVASDLDGTLLRSEPPISPRVIDALARVQDAGITVVLVTARNWRSVIGIAAEAGVTGMAICSNGAVVYDLDARTVHRAETADRDVLRSFVNACSELDGACIGWETATGAFRSPEYHELAQRDTGFSSVYLAAVEVMDGIADDHQVTKLLVRHPSLASDALLAELSPYADGVSLTVSGGAFVEVSRAGITKAHALEVLCRERGIDSTEVVAVGDQPNDLPMLLWAGRGVAMGNSYQSVLTAIVEHTLTNAEDGLALVLESVLEG